ncbi:hypothetical protein NW754_011039 [Fusarium falciforme]|nr:hypothetical protein NW754_011039 [Fusarium falciforme]
MIFGGIKGDVAQRKNIPSWWDAKKRADVEDFKSQAHKLGLKLLEVFATYFGLPADYFCAAHNDERGPGSVLHAKLEILKRGHEGKLVKDHGSIALTAGEYHEVRHHMSEKEDAKNNRVGKTEASSQFDPRVIHAVESLGIANGSGLLNVSPIAVKQ